ncbi:hypothetical protein [Bacillus phage FI_KG-Lek]|nr:hypothetical protein [Bacillus phage FI_KG-Lek]
MFPQGILVLKKSTCSSNKSTTLAFNTCAILDAKLYDIFFL